MGSGQSATRKVTIDNPDETVIKITDSVVDRLQEATKSDVSKESRSSSLQTTGAKTDAVFVTTQQIRREVDKEIEKNNIHWENRMKILRDGYTKINAELEEEYTKATKEVNQSLGSNYVEGDPSKTSSCAQSQESVVKCYNQNKSRPLLCSNEVQNFNECVTNRMSLALKVK